MGIQALPRDRMRLRENPSAVARAAQVLGFVRSEPLVVLCLLFLVFLVICALIPGIVAPHGATAGDLMAARTGPSLRHPFGADTLGRDVLSRIIFGTRLSLAVAVTSMVLGVVAGGAIGLVAGYAGGLVDGALMRLMDVMLAFPGVLLAMAIIAARGRGLDNLVLAIGIAAVPDYARLVRGQALSVRRRPYIEAARAAGAGPGRLIFRHILPNVLSPVLSLATIGIGFALLAGSSLSFIGLGAQPPSPEWGAMLADGRAFLNDAWWIATFPGLAIFFTVVSVNIVGQWLRDRFDVQRR